jgi:hypothetical protein
LSGKLYVNTSSNETQIVSLYTSPDFYKILRNGDTTTYYDKDASNSNTTTTLTLTKRSIGNTTAEKLHIEGIRMPSTMGQNLRYNTEP